MEGTVTEVPTVESTEGATQSGVECLYAVCVRVGVGIDTKDYIRKGKFQTALDTLNTLENPKAYGKDVYYLWELLRRVMRRTLYLLYMNGDFKTMSDEDIKKQLDFCGLSEEELKKITHRLTNPATQQYVLEKNLLSGAKTSLNVLLALIAAYLLILIFSMSNPSAMLNSTSSVFVAFPTDA